MDDQTPLSRRQFLTATVLAGAGLLIPRSAQAALVVRSYALCPILMYHYISDPPPDADAVRRDLSVGPDMFRQQVAAVKEQGFTSITIAQLYDGLVNGADLPTRPIVFTFDDGYADAYQFATPILAEQGMTGTFFVISGMVEQPGYLTWGQVAEMHGAGMEIGNHTVSHPNLAYLTAEQQTAEVEGCAAAIASVLGVRPAFFCYPLGRYSYTTIRIVRETGHLAAVTISDGTVQYSRYPYTLRRARVRGTTSLYSFNWLITRTAW